MGAASVEDRRHRNRPVTETPDSYDVRLWAPALLLLVIRSSRGMNLYLDRQRIIPCAAVIPMRSFSIFFKIGQGTTTKPVKG